jgi:hypothetical protein
MSPVMATEKCPRISDTVCNGAPAASMAPLPAECLKVWMPTPSSPARLAVLANARLVSIGRIEHELARRDPAGSPIRKGDLKSGWRDLNSRPLDPQIGGLMSSRAAERATTVSGVSEECRVIPY